MRRSYTETEKAHAVGRAIASSAEAASRDLGIPRTTLRQWLGDPAYDEMRQKTRDEVADELWAAIQLGVREVAKGITGDAPLRDKATALGILYDKHALLTGAATSRTEARDITGTLTDADLVAALRAADAITGGERAADAPPVAAAE